MQGTRQQRTRHDSDDLQITNRNPRTIFTSNSEDCWLPKSDIPYQCWYPHIPTGRALRTMPARLSRSLGQIMPAVDAPTVSQRSFKPASRTAKCRDTDRRTPCSTLTQRVIILTSTATELNSICCRQRGIKAIILLGHTVSTQRFKFCSIRIISLLRVKQCFTKPQPAVSNPSSSLESHSLAAPPLHKMHLF